MSLAKKPKKNGERPAMLFLGWTTEKIGYLLNYFYKTAVTVGDPLCYIKSCKLLVLGILTFTRNRIEMVDTQITKKRARQAHTQRRKPSSDWTVAVQRFSDREKQTQVK